MTCPRCKLEHPKNSVQCLCSYRFGLHDRLSWQQIIGLCVLALGAAILTIWPDVKQQKPRKEREEAAFKSQYEDLQRQVNATILSSQRVPSPTPRIDIQSPSREDAELLDTTDEDIADEDEIDVPSVPEWSPKDYTREQARLYEEIEAERNRAEANLRKSEAEWQRWMEETNRKTEQEIADLKARLAQKAAEREERQRQREREIAEEYSLPFESNENSQTLPRITLPRLPDYSSSVSSGYFWPRTGDVSVQGYFRQDGTYVQSHRKTAPDGYKYNNYSTYGNINPYTGKRGTRR